MPKRHTSITLPSGATAHVAPDAEPETVAALDEMTQAVAQRFTIGVIAERLAHVVFTQGNKEQFKRLLIEFAEEIKRQAIEPN